MSTSSAQENAHKLAIVAATGEQQRAIAVARAAFVAAGGGPAAQAALDASVKSADAAAMRAVIASSQLNGLGDGPKQSLYWLTGSYT